MKSIVRTLSRTTLSAVTSAVAAAPAFAVDTATTSLTNGQTWMDTWIPLICTLGLVVMVLVWWLGNTREPWVWKTVVALITVGSASYIISLFGLGGS